MARQIARLCTEHFAYLWLCGGVSMNYHSLADFRVAHGAKLDALRKELRAMAGSNMTVSGTAVPPRSSPTPLHSPPET